MIKVLSCIATDHDLRLILLAALVCFFASFTAIELVGRAREKTGFASRLVWACIAGTVAGCGIWATHFVAMLAFRSEFPIFYDISLTVLSIMASIALTVAGCALAVWSERGLLGGAVVGAAISVMHHIGMAAMSGPMIVGLDGSYIAASVLLGVAFGMLALNRGRRARSFRDTALAAALLSLAICATHFTAMTAITLIPVADASATGAVIMPASMAVAVAAVAMLVIGMGGVLTMMDQHRAERAQAEALRLHVAELEATKLNLEATSSDLKRALGDAAQGSEAKSQFLAAMSHELRTPLNAIMGYSELMQLEPYGPLGDQRYGGYVGSIHASGAHLLALINDVLDLARLEAVQVTLEDQHIELGAIIQDALRLVEPQAAKGRITLERPDRATLPRVRGDERRLLQVLLNLLSNAVKFTPPGGTVSVGVDRTAEGLAIEVRDTGIGIRPEDIAVALDRFGQLESAQARKHHGAGLGLPLARQLIELHGGQLTLASTPGVGTAVTITLPAQRVTGWPLARTAA